MNDESYDETVELRDDKDPDMDYLSDDIDPDMDFIGEMLHPDLSLLPAQQLSASSVLTQN